jgi:hypothetical protein
MLCQKRGRSHPVGAKDLIDSVLALSNLNQSSSEFLFENMRQIQFAIRAIFIALVLVTPKPPWILG